MTLGIDEEVRPIRLSRRACCSGICMSFLIPGSLAIAITRSLIGDGAALRMASILGAAVSL